MLPELWSETPGSSIFSTISTKPRVMVSSPLNKITLLFEIFLLLLIKKVSWKIPTMIAYMCKKNKEQV